VAAVVAVVALLIPPVLVPDSHSYIAGSLMRPPLIPILFRGLSLCFSDSTSTHLVVALQITLALVSCDLLARILGDRMGLPPALRILIGVVLSIPQWIFARKIVSESLAYSFLLLALLQAIRLLWGERSRGTLLGMVASCAALVSSRGQFVYLPPLCLLAVLLFVKGERTWRARATTLAASTCVGVCVLGLQAMHTLPKIHHFSRVAVTGVQEMVLTTFLATDAEVTSIPDPEIRVFSAHVRDGARAAGYLADQRGEEVAPLFFGRHYKDILMLIYAEYFEHVVGLPHSEDRDGMDADPALLVRLDQMTLAASAGVARHAWPRMVSFCLGEIFLWDRYLAILASGLFAVGLATLRRGGPLARLLLLVATLWWVNMLLVAALEPPQSRYTFYFDELVVVVALALAGRSLLAETVIGRSVDSLKG
jgi:4-amino-4-deoxy-L-arabinose transferase-like glycosyltransferase